MRRVIFVIFIALLASTSVAAYAEQIDKIDNEMVELLKLDQQQAIRYSHIMQQQRKAFLALQPHQWQQQLALYEETIQLLQSVLNTEQHTQFVTVLGCLIEETRSPEYLALE